MKKTPNLVAFFGAIPDHRSSAPFQHFKALVEQFDVFLVPQQDRVPDAIEARAQAVLKAPRDWKFGYVAWAVLQAIRLRRAGLADAAFSVRGAGPLFAGAICQQLGMPWIVDIWDDPELDLVFDQSEGGSLFRPKKLLRSLVRKAATRVAGRADRVLLALQRGIVSEFKWPDDVRLMEITNGFDSETIGPLVERSDQQSRDGGDHLTICRLSSSYPRERGLEVVLDALQLLAERGASFEFWHVGSDTGERRAWVEQQVAQRQLVPYVQLMGPLEHEAALDRVRRADICLCTLSSRVRNYRYAYPLKLFEYMAAGSPMVATDLPGISDIVEDGRTALLVPPENRRALAAAIENLIENPDLRRSLGRAAEREVENYLWKDIRSEIVETVRNTIERCTTPSRSAR